MTPADVGWSERYLRVLGDELRKERKLRGWVRKDLREKLGEVGLDISLQAIATYELGTRATTVVRLGELCHVLSVSPVDVLERTHHRVFGGGPEKVDLSTVEDDRLAPLRRWAQARANHGESTVVHLDPEALPPLAELCGLDVPELLKLLP